MEGAVAASEGISTFLVDRGRDGLAPLRTDLRNLQKREQDVRQQLEAKEKQAADLQVCLANIFVSATMQTMVCGCAELM